MPAIMLFILVVVCSVVIGVMVGVVFLLVRRPRTRKPILILAVVIGVAVRIWWVESVQPKFIMMKRAEMYRSAQSDFAIYQQDHSGAYPTDLTVFANAPVEEQPPSSEYTRPDWKSFYYVSGLTTNDPPGMPLLIYVPEDRRVKKGMVGFLGGGVMWYPLETIQRLIRAPWEVEGYWAKPIDEQTKTQLRQRVKVLPPIKLTEGMRITP